MTVLSEVLLQAATEALSKRVDTDQAAGSPGSRREGRPSRCSGCACDIGRSEGAAGAATLQDKPVPDAPGHGGRTRGGRRLRRTIPASNDGDCNGQVISPLFAAAACATAGSATGACSTSPATCCTGVRADGRSPCRCRASATRCVAPAVDSAGAAGRRRSTRSIGDDTRSRSRAASSALGKAVGKSRRQQQKG